MTWVQVGQGDHRNVAGPAGWSVAARVLWSRSEVARVFSSRSKVARVFWSSAGGLPGACGHSDRVPDCNVRATGTIVPCS